MDSMDRIFVVEEFEAKPVTLDAVSKEVSRTRRRRPRWTPTPPQVFGVTDRSSDSLGHPADWPTALRSSRQCQS